MGARQHSLGGSVLDRGLSTDRWSVGGLLYYGGVVEPPPDARPRGETILVVEDDRELLRDICVALNHAGYDTVGAESIENAVGTMRRLGPELGLVVTDFLLRDGIAPTIVSAVNTVCGSTPTIVITGLESPAIESHVDRCGAVQFLEKPFAISELTVLAAEALKSGKEARESSPPAARLVSAFGSGAAFLDACFAALDASVRLTPAERDLLRLKLKGFPYDAVADELRITKRTAQFHGSHVLQKFGTESFSDLLATIARIIDEQAARED